MKEEAGGGEARKEPQANEVSIEARNEIGKKVGEGFGKKAGADP